MISKGFGQRLAEAIGSRKKAEFAHAIAVRPHQLSRYLAGQIPDPPVLLKIAQQTGRTIDWLLTGREPARRSDVGSDERNAIVDLLDRLTDEERATVLRCAELLKSGDPDLRQHVMNQLLLLDRMRQRSHEASPQISMHPAMRSSKPGQRILRRVPVLSPVAAGRWRPGQDPYPVGQGFDEVETDLPGKYLYALKVEGHSMEPTYRDGEIIFVDPEQDAAIPGELGIWKRAEEEGVTFKQFVRKTTGELVLRALNPDYQPREIPLRDGDVPRGRVVAPRRRVKR